MGRKFVPDVAAVSNLAYLGNLIRHLVGYKSFTLAEAVKLWYNF